MFNDLLFFLKVGGELELEERRLISDKEMVKQHIARSVGKKYIVPTIKILETEEEIANYQFPENCCIKPTHASGLYILRKNGEPISNAEIQGWLGVNYYALSRERNYKTLIPKVIVEPLVFNDYDLINYRLFCYNGNVKFVNIDRGGGKLNKFLDIDWNEIVLSKKSGVIGSIPPMPKNFSEMIAVSRALSAGFSSLRVDMYSNGEEFYVGELTNCYAAANRKFRPLSDEKILSKYIFE